MYEFTFALYIKLSPKYFIRFFANKEINVKKKTGSPLHIKGRIINDNEHYKTRI